MSYYHTHKRTHIKQQDEKMDKWDLSKLKTFILEKDTSRKMKYQKLEENIFKTFIW